MEIIIHFQFENDDLAFSRLQSFKRRYKKYLFSVKEERVFTFISYIEQILKKPEIVQKSSFKFEIKNFIESDSQNDPFIKGFYHWLMKKIQ